MKTTDKVRFGLYGCNPYRTGSLIDAALKAFPENVEVAACFDINQDAADAMATRYNAQAYSQEEPFLQSDFEVVLVSLPAFLHSDAFVNCAAAGKDIYLEKPICIDQTGKEKILKAKKTFKGKCYVGLSDRYIFPFRKVAEIAKDGGKLISIHHHWLSPGTTQVKESEMNWRHRFDQCGGQLIHHCCHRLDFFRIVGGNVKSVTANAYTSDSFQFDFEEEELNACFEFLNGGRGVFNLSQRSHQSVQYGTVNLEDMGIYYEWGENTHIKIFRENSRIPDEIIEPTPTSEAERDFLQMQDFLDAYLNDHPMPITLDDGLMAYDMANAVRESYRAGQKVSIS